MRTGPLFMQLTKEIKQQIAAGVLPVGGFLPSARRLQELHGVSKNTVLAALRVLQEEKIIVREGASRHGFRVIGVPVLVKPKEVRGAGSFVKFLLPFSYWNFVGNRLLSAIEAELGKHEIGVLLGNHRNDIAVETSLLRRIIDHQGETVNALILMTASSFSNTNVSLIRQIAEQIPVFLLDRRVIGIDAHTVSLNNRKLGRSAAEYFLRRGMKRYGFFGGFWNVSSVRDRFAGFRDALNDAGIELAPCDLVHASNEYGQAQSLDEALMTLEEHLIGWDQLPEAVLCGSDKSAAALFVHCKKRGVRVPEDVTIIGCDGDEIVASKIGAAITSFTYPFDSIAEELTRLFLDHSTSHAASWRSIELEPIFVPGDTA